MCGGVRYGMSRPVSVMLPKGFGGSASFNPRQQDSRSIGIIARKDKGTGCVCIHAINGSSKIHYTGGKGK